METASVKGNGRGKGKGNCRGKGKRKRKGNGRGKGKGKGRATAADSEKAVKDASGAQASAKRRGPKGAVATEPSAGTGGDPQPKLPGPKRRGQKDSAAAPPTAAAAAAPPIAAGAEPSGGREAATTVKMDAYWSGIQRQVRWLQQSPRIAAAASASSTASGSSSRVQGMLCTRCGRGCFKETPIDYVMQETDRLCTECSPVVAEEAADDKAPAALVTPLCLQPGSSPASPFVPTTPPSTQVPATPQGQRVAPPTLEGQRVAPPLRAHAFLSGCPTLEVSSSDEERPYCIHIVSIYELLDLLVQS